MAGCPVARCWDRAGSLAEKILIMIKAVQREVLDDMVASPWMNDVRSRYAAFTACTQPHEDAAMGEAPMQGIHRTASHRY